MTIENKPQCPMCGRVQENWSERKGLVKGRQRADSEERTLEYREWRWNWGKGLYVTDIDQIEYRMDNKRPRFVAILELTRLDGDARPPPGYFHAILDRYRKRDAQAKATAEIARRLEVGAYIVLYRWNLVEFWVTDLRDTKGRWWHLHQKEYREWIGGGARPIGKPFRLRYEYWPVTPSLSDMHKPPRISFVTVVAKNELDAWSALQKSYAPGMAIPRKADA